MSKTAKINLTFIFLVLTSWIWGFLVLKLGQVLIPLHLTGSLVVHLVYLFIVLFFYFLVLSILGLARQSTNLRFHLAIVGLAFPSSVFLHTFQFYWPMLIGGLGIWLLSFLIIKNIEKRQTKFVEFDGDEILTSPARRFLFWSIVLTVLVIFSSLKIQTRREQLFLNQDFLAPILQPIVAVVNQQVSWQIKRKLGDRIQQITGAQEEQQVAQLVIDELKETTQEGIIRQQLGFQPERLRLDKIIVGPKGEINIWPAVVDLLPAITQRINQSLRPYFGYLPAAFSLAFWLGLQPWLLLIRVFLPFLAAGIINILKRAGFFKEKKFKKTVVRLVLE